MTEPRTFELPPGAIAIGATVVVAVSFIGFFMGTRVTGYADNRPVPVAQRAPSGDAPPARSYGELRMTPRGEQGGFAEDVAALNAAMPGVTDAVELSGTSKEATLAARASRRAYSGAPPTIPHMIRQDSVPECLACHEDGLRLGQRRAPMRPHEAFTSCTQCHVTALTPMPGGYELPVDPRDVPNSFVGMAAPIAGARAWSVAPPEIPHRTFMQERCASCHGVNGRDAIRSTHPWRQSCEQCHAPSAELDQR